MAGIVAGQLPGLEERRPVDPRHQVLERVIVEHRQAGRAGHRRHRGAPVDGQPVPPRIRERLPPLLRPVAAPLLPHVAILLAGVRDEAVAEGIAQQVAGHAHRPRGVEHVHGGPLVVRLDLHGGVDPRGRGAADEERNGEPLALHLARHERHFLERGGDEPAEPDDVDPLAARRLEDLGARHHHAEVDDLVVVALQHDAHDVLADVVDVTLHRGHEHAPVGLRHVGGLPLRLDVRDQVRDGLLHDARALHHLGQEHLPGAEQVADDVHAGHERALDHLDRALDQAAGLLGVLDDEVRDAFDQGVRQPLVHRRFPPGQVRGLRAELALHLVGHGEQSVGGVGAAVQHHVLDPLEQIGRDVGVDREPAGVHDPHVHARLDGVVEEHGVDRLADRVVAAEGERDVADPAAHEHVRQRRLDAAGGLDVVHRVVVVLLDPGADGEDVRIEDDVLGREADALGQDPVAAGADVHLPLGAVRLPLLVERHDDHGGAVAPDQRGVPDELLFALLEADGVHHALPLDALEARLDHRPLGRVEHHRHAADPRLRGDELEEFHHGRLGVEHPFVHVDVDHLRAALHLLARDLQARLVVAREDQLARTCASR